MNGISVHEQAESQPRLLAPGEPASSSNGEEDQVAAAERGPRGVVKTLESEKPREEPVTWRSLPHRRQLIILTLARLSEPLVQTSLQVGVFIDIHLSVVSNVLHSQSYMFYQLRSFDETLPNSTIAAQAGLMASSFTGAQFLTAMMWGRVSDSERGGRKLVLIIGLFGTSQC